MYFFVLYKYQINWANSRVSMGVSMWRRKHVINHLKWSLIFWTDSPTGHYDCARKPFCWVAISLERINRGF
jgi:hypothetical protein